MAKKDKDTIYSEFLADLKALNPKIEEVLADEKVSAKLRESVLARADYSQSMDSLKADRETFAAEVQEARQKIAGWQQWYGTESQKTVALEDELKKYRETYGQLDAGDQRRVAQQQGFLTKEDFQAALDKQIQQRDMAALKFADDLTDIKIDFSGRFKEKLDTTPVYQIAAQRGLDLRTAYNEYISDRVEEQRKSAYDDAIKAAREEGARDFASKHNLPSVPSSPDMVHYADVKDVPKTSRDRISAAIQGMNDLVSHRR